ncbi:hypothetical protein JTB14_003174 [Gonioctena quinquepunctata]|nr:hypothetical protein JTB14_003174 [Gonioctena quinquepunctata]
MLNCAGTNPEKGYGKSQFSLYLGNMIAVLSLVYLMVLKYVYEGATVTDSDFTYDVSCMFLFLHGMLKTTTMFAKKAEIMKLLKETKFFWGERDLGRYPEILHQMKKDQKAIQNIARFMQVMNFFTSSGFLVEALFTTEEILPARCYRPEWLNYYILLFCQEFICLLTVLLPISAMDFIFMTTVRLTRIQFRILNREMEQIFDGVKEEDTREKKRIFDRRIKRCVDHHDFLLRYGQQINETFSMSVLLFLIIIILSMCVEMYSLSTETNWEGRRRALVYTVTGCIEFLVCYCYPCQDLMDESLRISNSVYTSKWYEHPEFGRHVLSIVKCGQRIRPIKAGKFSNLDLGTGLSIGPRKKYSQDQMNAALEAVAREIPVATAAKIHSIPRVTLMYKSSGRLPTECRMGPSTVLTTNEEDLLEKWILSLAKVHHPVNKEQLLDSIKVLNKYLQ